MMTESQTTGTPATSCGASPKTPVIGLLGGVASGKSTVARMFADLGAAVIDADKIAHQVLQSDAVCETLRKHWGEAPFDEQGRPDRARIADIVFGHPEKLAQLNQWVHPETRQRMRDELQAARCQETIPIIVVDAPLLLEAGLDQWCNALVFVETPAEQRRERAVATRHWAPEELARREERQASLDTKRRRAVATILNSGSPEETRSQVADLFRHWTHSLDALPPNDLSLEGE